VVAIVRSAGTTDNIVRIIVSSKVRLIGGLS